MTDTTPTTTPAKKSSWTKIVGPVIGVLVVIGVIIWQVVLPAMEDAKYKVDACLNTLPESEVQTNLDERPAVVDCSDSAAKSKIIAVIENKTVADAPSACPEEWFAAISVPASSFLSKDKLLCLIEA